MTDSAPAATQKRNERCVAPKVAKPPLDKIQISASLRNRLLVVMTNRQMKRSIF